MLIQGQDGIGPYPFNAAEICVAEEGLGIPNLAHIQPFIILSQGGPVLGEHKGGIAAPLGYQCRGLQLRPAPPSPHTSLWVEWECCGLTLARTPGPYLHIPL